MFYTGELYRQVVINGNMLSYELAKELKDAGFSQMIAEFGLSHYYIEPERIGYLTHDGQRDILAHDDDYDKNWAKIPTLEELIEACVKKLLSLNTDIEKNYFELSFNYGEDGELIEWRAGHQQGYDLDNISRGWNYFGERPKEAVARLWLALNKK